jgi:hypothetical protein
MLGSGVFRVSGCRSEQELCSERALTVVSELFFLMSFDELVLTRCRRLYVRGGQRVRTETFVSVFVHTDIYIYIRLGVEISKGGTRIYMCLICYIVHGNGDCLQSIHTATAKQQQSYTYIIYT